MDKFNYTMLCDFYELTMGNGYFVSGMQERYLILICFSDRYLTVADLPLPAVLSRS